MATAECGLLARGKINVLSACLIDLYFLELDRGRETRRKLRPA